MTLRGPRAVPGPHDGRGWSRPPARGESCELPCEAPLEFTTSDWTRIVRQDGSATSAVAREQYGTQGDNLWMLHRIEDPSDPGTFTFGYRGKKSR